MKTTPKTRRRLTRRPAVRDVRAFLRSRNALIVHFSGTPAGVSSRPSAPLRYPDDLQYVLNGGAATGLACSVVTPADNFDIKNPPCNAFGCIGVILDLVNRRSLCAATPWDGGSWVNDAGVREFDDRDLSTKDLDDSLVLRKDHNEWGMANFRAVGILAAFPYTIDCPRRGLFNITLSDVQRDFAGHPIYLFSQNRLIRLASADDIYK